MKFFGQDSYRGRINFVDENNVALGYDYSSSCCENFGYFLNLQKLLQSLDYQCR